MCSFLNTEPGKNTKKDTFLASEQKKTPKVRGSSMVRLYFLEQLQSVWGNRKIHNSLFKTRLV